MCFFGVCGSVTGTVKPATTIYMCVFKVDSIRLVSIHASSSKWGERPHKPWIAFIRSKDCHAQEMFLPLLICCLPQNVYWSIQVFELQNSYSCLSIQEKCVIHLMQNTVKEELNASPLDLWLIVGDIGTTHIWLQFKCHSTVHPPNKDGKLLIETTHSFGKMCLRDCDHTRWLILNHLLKQSQINEWGKLSVQVILV